MSESRFVTRGALILSLATTLACGSDPTPGTAEDEEHRRQEAIAQLEAIGYVAGSEEATAHREGITVHEPNHTQPGFTLYCSGHGPEANLMTLDGTVIHTWRRPLADVWPEFEPSQGQQAAGFWRRVHLEPDGSLLAIFDGIVLIKLDRDSELVWQFREPFPHHDLFVADDGTITVLTRKGRFNPDYSDQQPLLEDFVSVLTPQGREIERISILDAFERSDYRALLHGYRMRREAGDLLHANTVEVLDGTLADRLPAFRAGNILLSLLNLDSIAVLDPESQSIVWAMTGLTQRQHQPTLLPNGRLLVFDNQGARLVRFKAPPKDYRAQRAAMEEAGARSRLLEIDPLTRTITWRYEGSDTIDFYSHDCGSVQPLANGNLLITESNAGRAFELTRQRNVVWEFRSPHRTRTNADKTANLFEALRIPEAEVRAWLPNGPNAF